MRSLNCVSLIFVLIIAVAKAQNQRVSEEWLKEHLKDTAQRIADHGYPAESHFVETPDNYVIGLFRIPYSHKLQNQAEKRPVVFLQHGFSSCSDGWILNGPNDALAFLFADAGYDVWLGNARGNRYSRNNTRLSTRHPHFWSFSWHEIGYYDIASVFDYILNETNEPALHYVGHSQGTSVFFVLMSTRPEYNAKIKTAHLLAPVAFMSNIKTPLAKYTRRFVGKPNPFTHLIDNQEILPSSLFFAELEEIFCRGSAIKEFACSNLFFLISGDDGVNINKTISAHANETHPAGASTTQLIHFMQEYESGRFHQLDLGAKKNMKKYGQPTPPDYDVSQITAAMSFYYADADDLSDVIDVEHLATLVATKPNMLHVEDPTFDHTDFTWSMQVKEVINIPIINACNLYEQQAAANEIKLE